MSVVIPFLSRKVLFVTGATGFLGKGTVEKILRHAPEVGRVYLMVRPRSRGAGKPISVGDRLNREVLQSNAFARLRAELGDRFNAVMREKLVAVPGDLSKDRLGMDAETYARLTREVDIVINSAATVVFDEPLDFALTQNTLGAMRIVEFAKACSDAVLVHVSTAYVNGRQKGIISEDAPIPDQTVAHLMGDGRALNYELDAEIESILAYSQETEAASRRPERFAEFTRLLDKQDRGKRVTAHRREHQLEALRQRWVRDRMVARGMQRGRELGWHDSYSFTKAMGEQIIAKMRGELPTVIVRPSIIESSLSDPEPGWLEGLKVADPIIVHYGKGRLTDFPARPETILDIIPVDIIINAIIGVLPAVKASSELRVYHVTTGARNPVTLGEVVQYVHEYFVENPMRDRQGKPIAVAPWTYPTLPQFRRKLRYRYQLPIKMAQWALDRVPLIDVSKKKRHLSILNATLENTLSLADIYTSYMSLDCVFQNENMTRLFNDMDAEDQEIFNCDVSRIDWPRYLKEIHIPGLQRHVLKTAAASKRQKPSTPPERPTRANR